MDRDRVAEEAGREHTGGLGEREGAGTSGGADAGLPDLTPASDRPTGSDEDVGEGTATDERTAGP